MDYITQLTDATDPAMVGGKAANLSRLLKTGISVPPGFAITTQAFNEIMGSEAVGPLVDRTIAAIEKGANIEELELLANNIRRTMQDTGLQEAFTSQLIDAFRSLRATSVAVRSSATEEDGMTAAWAGQLETYLYINSEAALCSAVIDCWASLYSPRALTYRLSRGMLHTPVAVAVLVQFMIVAEKSGVVFTADPITNDPDTIVVEAVWGDCEQLVSGEVTPDSYRFGKQSDLLTSAVIATQTTCRSQGQQFQLSADRAKGRKLNDGELLQLSRLCSRAEECFGRPQDIEWAYASGTCYLLQARPITAFTLA